MINEHSETILLFKTLSEGFILDYVSHNNVTNFAGGYAAQDNDEFIEVIEGDYENVIGAPMKNIISHLKNLKLDKTFFKALGYTLKLYRCIQIGS